MDEQIDIQGNILSVDWGSKYIGMAYYNTQAQIIFPIGYIMNDTNLFFNVGDILGRYTIGHVVVGYPKQHVETQQAINEFLKNVVSIDEDITFEKVDEEYSSVEANAKTDSYTKDSKEDTLAAMILLENYLETKDIEH